MKIIDVNKPIERRKVAVYKVNSWKSQEKVFDQLELARQRNERLGYFYGYIFYSFRIGLNGNDFALNKRTAAIYYELDLSCKNKGISPTSDLV